MKKIPRQFHFFVIEITHIVWYIYLGSVFLNVYFSQTTELEDECVRISKGGFGLHRQQRKHNLTLSDAVEGTSVINGPKRNKGPICNNFWTQV